MCFSAMHKDATETNDMDCRETGDAAPGSTAGRRSTVQLNVHIRGDGTNPINIPSCQLIQNSVPVLICYSILFLGT